jgi:dimethylhistidine N-methyltransferase
MDSSQKKPGQLSNFNPGLKQFQEEVLKGLRQSPKELPTKYLYDERGSNLYERICSLDEYYIPRTEAAIMESNIDEIIRLLGPEATLVEYGCGNCTKTRILLDNMVRLTNYVPIDISYEQLHRVAAELGQCYSGLEILPVCADYTEDIQIPFPEKRNDRIVTYFPGSSIGNFNPRSAIVLLSNIARVCGPGGALLIGVDLKKDIDVLYRAYNDRDGITAAFNMNLLHRINRELHGDFQMNNFEHHAFYNPDESRVEMHLVSLKEQTVNLDNTSIYFKKGESIWTESSYKYEIADFRMLADAAGFSVEKVWTDERNWFSVQYLVVA